MARQFTNIASDPFEGRYAAELEHALLARALVEAGSLPDKRVKELLRSVYRAKFNARAVGFDSDLHPASLEWQPEGTGYRLVWYAPGDIVCPLARVYLQDDNSWAVLVVAGVKDDIHDAFAQAEWAISRLTES